MNPWDKLQIVATDYKSGPEIINRGNGLLMVATDYKSWPCARIINRGNGL